MYFEKPCKCREGARDSDNEYCHRQNSRACDSNEKNSLDPPSIAAGAYVEEIKVNEQPTILSALECDHQNLALLMLLGAESLANYLHEALVEAGKGDWTKAIPHLLEPGARISKNDQNGVQVPNSSLLRATIIIPVSNSAAKGTTLTERSLLYVALRDIVNQYISPSTNQLARETGKIYNYLWNPHLQKRGLGMDVLAPGLIRFAMFYNTHPGPKGLPAGC